MRTKPKGHDLGDSISELLINGITITDDVMHYIDSTFSNPSLEEFAQIISDPENCEAETVYELVFFPDLVMQENLESILITNSYNKDDIDFAAGYLTQKKMTVPITFPDQQGTLEIPLTESIITQLLLRLKISKPLDARLNKTLSDSVTDASDTLRLRVMLRNCRTEFSDTVVIFLCTCIKKLVNTSPYFWDALTFLLNFFEYTDPDADIYLSLMKEKRNILHSIEQAEKNETALKNNSVEALMLKGISMLSINIADARKKSVLIDHICISIFGKTELYGQADQSQMPVTVRNFNPDELPQP